ncbi:hypothetical protein NW752_009309 [Fusarium irregulare]|nr:hypothetical protein NW752_009309 [Fusarium irregulare]
MYGCKRNKLDCIWPDPAASAPSNSSATSSAKVAAAVSRSSRPSFGASSTGSQTSISSSLRRSQDRDQEYDQGQGRDPHSATDPVLPDSAPDQDRAFADNPSIVVPHNGDSSPVSGDTHMIDAHDTQVDDDDHDVETVVNDNADHQPSHSPSSSASSESPTAITTYDSDTANAITLALPPSPEGGLPLNGVITMPMSMLPEQGHHSYELLSYYLDRTANSMGNGSTDVNPFISKLIPLAFSKPLVLQLILAQSAAHRQASAERHPSDEIAQRYYTDSLRMFRNVVDEYVSGNAENTLIFHLGQVMSSPTVDGAISPSPDNIVNFAFLQSQVMAFYPDPSVTPYTRLAGLVWKQAALLYLWTVLGKPHQQPEGSFQRALVESAVAEAVTLLDQFPATVRINTSLCWPLAVIGCSTSDPSVQQVLRTRLQTMLDTIGLGNMKQTLVLLEHIWEQPPEQVSPWMLCRAMRERQIWISFA